MISLKQLITEAKAGAKKITRDAFLYLSPKEPKEQFAQCGTCMMFTGTGCTILGKTKVTKDMSCGLYVHGKPSPKLAGKEKSVVTPKEAGLVNRAVRCENCRAFDNGVCMLFKTLNESNPDLFQLDEKVDDYGCCNAQMPKSENS